MTNKRYRVAQWGTGHTGLRSLIGVIGHPNYDLVALRVFSDFKEGKDAGAICGLGSTGILATQSTEQLIAANPDCVLYMPKTDKYDIDEMCLLLESGINIVTLCAEWHFRDSIKSDIRSRLETACKLGNSSLYATGPSPGFATEVLPLVLSMMERRLDRIKIHEYADMISRSTPEMLEFMFGWEPGERNLDHVSEHLRLNFGDSFRQTAATLGMPLDDVTVTGSDTACATEEITVAGYTVKKGTVAAWQFEVTGWHKGKPLLVFGNTWFITRNLDKDWPTRDTGWGINIDGDAPMDIDLYFDRKNFVQTQPSMSANGCVNAVPYVCDAKPGILHTDDLPMMFAQFS